MNSNRPAGAAQRDRKFQLQGLTPGLCSGLCWLRCLHRPAVVRPAVAQGARRIGDGALENICPIRVARVSDRGDLVLNQGGETLSEGDQLEVYAIGQVDRDPYTGESLGAHER